MGQVRRKLGSRRKLVAFWLSQHAPLLGIPLLILAVATLFALLAIPMLPTGPVTLTEGTITGIGIEEDYGGSFTSASVTVDDRTVRVRLPSRHACTVGDTIQLRQRPTRWGRSTKVAIQRWPCSRP